MSANRSGDWSQVVREVGEAIAALEPGQNYELYKLVYRAFRRLGMTDSFYVCLYVEGDKKPLWFPFNIDGEKEILDDPDRLVLKPAGQGPTSTVVHTRRPFMLDPDNEPVQRAASNFGDRERKSRSAIHVPILAAVGTSRERLFGVVSAQCYEPSVYDEDHLSALTALANHMGRWLFRQLTPEERSQPRTSQSPGERRPHPAAVEVADEVVRRVHSIRRRAELFWERIPAGDPLKEEAEALCDECRCVEVEVNQLPNRADLVSARMHQATPDPERARKLDALTATERNILEALGSGDTVKEMAARLRINYNTCRSSIRSIYTKLDVTTRTQALRFLDPSSG